MANDINSVFLIGRLTRDPEIRHTQNGTAVATVSIANNYKYGDRESVSYFNCVAWAKSAEIIAEYCKKGQRIGIEGRIQQRSWDDADGKKRQVVEIVIENFQFLSAKESTADQHDLKKSSASSKKPDLAQDNQFSDEDIPF